MQLLLHIIPKNGHRGKVVQGHDTQTSQNENGIRP